MPLAALALVVAAAFLHAAWNFVAKKADGNRHFAFICGGLIVALWAPAGLALGAPQVPGWTWRQWGCLLASGLVNLGYIQALLKGYRVADLTVVYPVARGTGPLISALAATVVFGESLGVHGALGVAGVCAGVFVIAGGPALWRAAHDPARRARVRAGLAWGLATGVMIAGYTVIDGYSVKRLGLAPVVVNWFGCLLRQPFMLPGALRDWPGVVEAWRRYRGHAALVAVVSPLAYILVLQAVRMAPLSHVAPAREVSMLFAALLGGRLLGEGERGLRTLGALLMGAGVALLAL